MKSEAAVESLLQSATYHMLTGTAALQEAASSAKQQPPPGPLSALEPMQYLKVGLALLGPLACCLLAFIWRLGVERDILTATARCLAQLLLLGLVAQVMWLRLGVAGYWMLVVGMMLLGWLNALVQPRVFYKGIRLHILISTWLGSLSMMLYGSVILLPEIRQPLDLQYLLPLAGMMLTATASGTSQTLNALLEGMLKKKRHIEMLLAYGGSRQEASEEHVRGSVREALKPVLAQHGIAGLWLFPPFMMGQILAGTKPLDAALFQMVYILLTGAAVVVSSLSVAQLARYQLLDKQHRLRIDLIHSTTGLSPFRVLRQFFIEIYQSIRYSIRHIKTAYQAGKTPPRTLPHQTSIRTRFGKLFQHTPNGSGTSGPPDYSYIALDDDSVEYSSTAANSDVQRILARTRSQSF